MKTISLQNTPYQARAATNASHWTRSVIQDTASGATIHLFIPKELRFNRDLQQRLLALYFSRGNCCHVSSSPSTQVTYHYIPEFLSMCYLKRFFLRNTSDYFKHIVRPSRAGKTFHGGALLQKHGFAAPASLGILETRRYGCVITSALLMSAVPQSTSLIDVLRHSDLSRTNRHILAKALGREIGRMHALGIFHGDMNAGNILVSYQENTPTFTWIDNERVRRYTVLPQKLRLKNLRQLNCIGLHISHSDRLRVWSSYCRQFGLARSAAKRERRTISEQTKIYWSRFGTFTGRSD